MSAFELNNLWLLTCCILVILMQAGFLCVETGLTRNKNNINVAAKNLTDFCVSILMFRLVGFVLMFGTSYYGFLGLDSIDFTIADLTVDKNIFFLYQASFCGTAITILSGAVAERVKIGGYLMITILLSGLVYPIFGHWAWNMTNVSGGGFLRQLGFIDFAGSTVVHSVGGWAALAVLIIIGPRKGIFNSDGSQSTISGSSIPLAAFGVLLLWIGWIGFNGGSTYSFDSNVPIIVGNTIMAGASGLVISYIISWLVYDIIKIKMIMNGLLAGLVSITASAHAVGVFDSIIIGMIGAVMMYLCINILNRYKIDDAVGAISVHLAAGIWGTLAVALFSDLNILATGHSMFKQLQIQCFGILVCAIWTFGIVYLIVKLLDYWIGFRVSEEHENIGLNISEHGAKNDLFDLFQVMEKQSTSGDLSIRAPVESFTQIGQISEKYNNVLGHLEASRDKMLTQQQEIIEKYKMAELGQLISGIAHEINTPLGVIKSSIDNISNSFKIIQNDMPLLFAKLTENDKLLFFNTVNQSNNQNEFLSTKKRRQIKKQLKVELEDSGVPSPERIAEQLIDIDIYENLQVLIPLLKHEYSSEIIELIYRICRVNKASSSITMSVGRASDIVTALRSYSGKHNSDKPVLTNVVHSIETVLILYYSQMKKGIQIEKEYDKIPEVHAFPDKLIQVWANLINNAIQSMGNVGKLLIKIQNLPNHVSISFIDSGKGIEKSIQDKIFEPFFSTKTLKKGTGLGLSLSKKFIELNHGTLQFESKPGKTKFTVTLPKMISFNSMGEY